MKVSELQALPPRQAKRDHIASFLKIASVRGIKVSPMRSELIEKAWRHRRVDLTPAVSSGLRSLFKEFDGNWRKAFPNQPWLFTYGLYEETGIDFRP